VQEAEGLARRAVELAPIGARGFQQREAAVDVGAHELARAQDGAVDVALGGEVHDRARLELAHQRQHRVALADV
jgi:hypothetical protein